MNSGYGRKNRKYVFRCSMGNQKTDCRGRQLPCYVCLAPGTCPGLMSENPKLTAPPFIGCFHALFLVVSDLGVECHL